MNSTMESYELLLQRVEALMKGVGLSEKSAELPVRQLMHHLLMARVMYETMTAEERAIVDIWQKKTKKVYDAKCVLKEGESKQRKEKSLSALPYKEKEKKERDDKTTQTAAGASSDVSDFFKARKEAFRKACFSYSEKYPEVDFEAFFDYWSEKMKRREMMKWETKQSWELENRIRAWKKKCYTVNDTEANIRLERTKGKASQQERDTQQQQMAAQARRQQEEIERQKDEETKAGRMSIDEYIQKNPDSMMAKMYRENHKNDNGGLRPK